MAENAEENENPGENENTDYNKYYHYTDRQSAIGILESRVIRQSEDTHNDAVMGKGIYFTQLDPSTSKHEVAKNNYDDNEINWKSKIEDGKTDAVIEVKFRKDEVQDYSSELKRDVHVHRGNILLEEVKDPKIHFKTGDKTYLNIQ